MPTLTPPMPIAAPLFVPARSEVGQRRNNYNLLRLILAALVLLAHSSELIDGDRSRELMTRTFGTLSFGEVAVYGFFLLSGKLIVQSWQRDPHLAAFLWKRFRRIYPGFIVASSVSALLVAPLATDPQQYFAAFDGPRFARDLLLLKVPELPPVFQGSPYAHVNAALWTIEHEFKCYLLVALFGVAGWLSRRPGWLLATSAVLGLDCFWNVGFTAELLRPLRESGHAAITVELRLLFLLGGCFALYADRVSFRPRFALFAGAALLLALFDRATAHPAFALAGGYLLFYFAQADVPQLRRLNRLPDVSYGLYLYGWPVQKLLTWYLPSLGPPALFALSLCLACVLGLVSWYAVERPFMRISFGSSRSTVVCLNSA